MIKLMSKRCIFCHPRHWWQSRFRILNQKKEAFKAGVWQIYHTYMMIFFISSSLAQMLCFNILDTEYEAVPEAQPMIGLDHKCYLSLLFSITNWHWIHTCKDLNMFEISKSLLRGCLPVVGGLDKETPCRADTHPLRKEPEWIIWQNLFVFCSSISFAIGKTCLASPRDAKPLFWTRVRMSSSPCLDFVQMIIAVLC